MLLHRADDTAQAGPFSLPSDEMAGAIARQIERAAYGRISDLHVDHLGESIVLKGRCRTYHVKQLAHQAALEMADGSTSLIDLIVVN